MRPSHGVDVLQFHGVGLVYDWCGEVKRRRGARPASLRPTGSDRLLLHQESYGPRSARSAQLRDNTVDS